MRYRRILWPLLSALVILTQLCQPLGLVPAAASQPLPSATRPEPAVAPAQAPLVSLAQPGTSAASNPVPPKWPAPEPAAAPQGGPSFPYSNNNLGQSYFDNNNPDNHPGRHFAGPVNLINGNVFLTTGDAFFAARGLSVEFARSYNSQDTQSGPLGPGWTHSYNSAVITSTVITAAVPGSVVVIRGGDGTLYPYTFNGSNWQPPAGYFRYLQHYIATDPYNLYYKNGLVEIYDPNGRLRSTADRNNNQLSYGYDLLGRLTNITDTSGVHGLTLTYYVSNTLQSVTDPLGRMTTYQYDGTGHLSQVNYPEGTHATYTYDGSGRLVAYSDPRQPAGTTQATITYNAGNQATQVKYRIDGFFDISYSVGQTDWTDSAGDQQRITYDSSFNVTNDQTFVGGSFRGDLWQYSTMTSTLPISKTDANGNQTQYAYDVLGNLTFVTDSVSAVTHFEYDLTHNNVLTATNPLGQITLYNYDLRGNLTQETDPLGHTLVFTVTATGDLSATLDSAGRLTTYTYDPFGFGNLVGVTDPNGFTITHAYDAVGRVITTTDPSGRSTVYVYDASDRLVDVRDPLTGTLHYQYDFHSNLTRVVDPEGEIITHTFDNLDRLINVTDALGHSTQYQYDGAGRLTQRTDATGATTTYDYDGANRLISRIYSGGQHEYYYYDPGGRLTSMTNGTISTTIAYDRASRPISITLMAPGFTGPTQANYTYDAMGERVQARLQDSSGQYWQTNYKYDALGRLVETKANNNPLRLWTTTYDAQGCRATRTLPDGSHEAYTYDAGCRLLQLNHFDPASVLLRSFGYSYDSRGNLLSEQDGTQISNYTYDALSRLATANTPEGLTTHTYGPSSERLTTTGPGSLNTVYHYDEAGHLTGLNSTTYQYDAMGRRVSQTGPAGARTFVYDGEMRLHSFFDVFTNVNLDYDPLGQLVRKQGGPGGATYYLNGAGRVEAELNANGSLSRTFTIDTEIVALNLIGAASFDYHYDGRGRVRWVTDGAGHTIATYSTDPTSNNNSKFYNPIRVIGSYFFPELNLYLIGDGQFWDPWSGTFIFRAWPWVFWPFGPFSAWHAIFRYWPWPWLWPRPWAWPWPRPWAWQWPWPGVWVRPWLIWPLWPWPVQPFWPWWWWWHWWWWPAWGHWWQWQWWGWWGWWWNWAWWGNWWWPWWWWPWWWWWPCWWMWWAWWGWWGWWWWWGWCWWWWGWWWWWWGWWPWWWGWGWWWVPWYWVPYLPRPPSHLLFLPLVRR